jgi:hypothetical protein
VEGKKQKKGKNKTLLEKEDKKERRKTKTYLREILIAWSVCEHLLTL